MPLNRHCLDIPPGNVLVFQMEYMNGTPPPWGAPSSFFFLIDPWYDLEPEFSFEVVEPSATLFCLHENVGVVSRLDRRSVA